VVDGDTSIRRNSLISSIITKVTVGSTLDEILDDVYRELRALLPYDRISIVLVEPDKQRLRLVAAKSSSPLELQAGYVGSLQGSSLGEVITRNDAVILNDLGEYLNRRPASDATRRLIQEGMKASLAIPLVAGTETIGALTFSSKQPGVYTNDHVRVVRDVAGQIAIATEKARLISQLRDRNIELARAYEFKADFARKLEDEVARRTARERFLLQMTNAMTASLDVESVFRVTVREIRALLTFDRASITLVDDSGTHMRFRALEPPEREILGRNDVIPIENSSIGRAIRDHRVVTADDLETNRTFSDEHLLFRAGIRSYVFTPLMLQGRAIGCFNLASTKPRAYGADDVQFLQQVTEQMTFAVANAKAYEEIRSLKDKLHLENITLKEEISNEHHFFEVVGSHPVLLKAMRDAERVAQTDATVLVLGETGTGKELIARAIHRLSSRRDRAMVKVNCAALPESLIASELFGHERGSFTGAVARKLGRFELASGGTLFLDEIGELPLEIQAKILRVLQDGEFERVGGIETLKADVRIIAATNRDLETAAATGAFRRDLYYRLNVFPISLPPLRDRVDDLDALVNHLAMKYGRRLNKKIARISQASMQLLRDYRWPGNIRELENVIERTVIVCDTDILEVDPRWLQPSDGSTLRRQFKDLPDLESHLQDVERRFFEKLLASMNGRIYGPKGAAKLLGLKPTTLQSRLRKLGLR